MWFNPRYGKVGLLGLPYYLLAEIVAPVVEVLALATLTAGAVTGLVDWREFALLTLLVTLANSALTTGALLMLDLNAKTYRLSRMIRLLALMPVEMIVYRPILAWARVKGTWGTLGGTSPGTSSSATHG